MDVHPGNARWDLFCRVVDNLGDIGVSWRLARCLQREHGCQVRLWVDNLQTFALILHSVDPQAASQLIDGVEIGLWGDGRASQTPADVVIEAFGCGLPEAYRHAMEQALPRAVWIQLEYLSAEPWIDEFHGRKSLFARSPLVKHFFFPGFSIHSGGLLHEHNLECSRKDFEQNPALQAAWWARAGLSAPAPHERRVSLFAYANRALACLLDAWASDKEQHWTVIVPRGVLADEIEHYLGDHFVRHGTEARKGALTLKTVPFFDQDDYDRLLWACDLNFVRGEDSFVRAQWARRPFVWQIYPQAEAAHQIKLDAFLDRYLRAWSDEAAAKVRAFWHAWNREDPQLGTLWAGYWRTMLSSKSHTAAWADSLHAHGDLASHLMKFVAIHAA